MGIMQRTTPHGIGYSVECDDGEWGPHYAGYLTMLDAYILAHALDTTQTYRAHYAAHERDIEEMQVWSLAQQAGYKPAHVCDPYPDEYDADSVLLRRIWRESVEAQ